VVLGKHSDLQIAHLVYCNWWTPGAAGRVDLEAVEKAVIEQHKRFRFNSVQYDPHQAQYMADRLRKAGVNMVEVPFVGKHLNEMASTLLEVFRSHQIRLFDCPRLAEDLQRLMIVEKSFGFKLEAIRDEGGHADTATALALALPALRRLSNFYGMEWGGIIHQLGFGNSANPGMYGEKPNPNYRPGPVPGSIPA